jgi:hypothetical protein
LSIPSVLSSYVIHWYEWLNSSVSVRLVEPGDDIARKELYEWLWNRFQSEGSLDEHYRSGLLPERVV